MNEIEKLYENAGIPKYGKRQCRDSEYLECQNYCFINMDNKCDKFGFIYPSFTAEKQLELIKFCFDKYEVIGKTPDVDRCILYITSDAEDRAFVVTDYISCETWEESIAGLINRFWQDFTEKEKQQIKEILE